MDELDELRKLLIDQRIRWMNSYKTKTSDRIVELELKLSVVSNCIYALDDYLSATNVYNKITLDEVEKCFYGFDAKKHGS